MHGGGQQLRVLFHPARQRGIQPGLRPAQRLTVAALGLQHQHLARGQLAALQRVGPGAVVHVQRLVQITPCLGGIVGQHRQAHGLQQ